MPKTAGLFAVALMLWGVSAAVAQNAPGAAAPAAVQAPGAVSAYPTAVNEQTVPASAQNNANPANMPARNQQNASEQGTNGQGQQRQPTPQPLTSFQQMVAATTGRTLPVFGANLFNGAPSTFVPVVNVPVPPDYVIGPGDEVNIQIWGQESLLGSYTVDRTGMLQMPGIGTVRVAGLPYSQLQDFLKSRYSQIYRNFGFSASLGQLRSIQIFVTGYAVQPGSYTIGSLSTLIDALFACGGPLPNGSMRNIQVKRGDTTVNFDLYDFLLRGDKSKSIPLQQGDIVFIPPAGPQVAVLGSVNASAVYELKQETTVPQVLQLAGGETNVAADAQIRLERIFQHNERSVLNVSLTATPPVTVQDGDIISVAAVLDRFVNAVTLRGNVANPGRYVWRSGYRISDLIPNKESLLTRNYFARQNQLGQPTPQVLPEPVAAGTPQQQATTPGAAMPGATAPASGTNQSGALGANSISSALTQNNPGFSVQNQVVLAAPDIDWSYAVVARQSANDLTTSLIPFNLGKLVLEGDQSQNLELQPGDVITIFSKADIAVPLAQRTRYVNLEGEFVNAGVYSVQPGESLRHLIARAGGFTSDAYLYASAFTRESVRRLQQQRLAEYADQLDAQIAAHAASESSRSLTTGNQNTGLIETSADTARTAVARLRQTVPSGRLVLNLEPESAGIDSIPDLKLEDGDRFIVPARPDIVTVEGQVYNANAFLYRSGWRVKNYMHEAGGPDREADRHRTFVLRADGSVVSDQYAHVEASPVYAGDTVVVPQKISDNTWFRNVIDISTVLTGMGIPLATLYLLAKQ